MTSPGDVDWPDLTARAGTAAHDLVGWLMWDPGAIARYEALGVPGGTGWIVAWRLAALGEPTSAVAGAVAYSIGQPVIDAVLDLQRGATDTATVLAARDDSIEPGLEQIAPGLLSQVGGLADDLWRGVDAVHHGARPMFAAHRALPRPGPDQPGLSAWLAVNCLRELRGDNHWALCASEGLDDVEVGLLHSAMIDVEEYGDEEWIARSRGADDLAVAAAWERLASRGFAGGAALNDAGRRFRFDLETRTDALTEPAWRAVGAECTAALCEAVEAHHEAFVARIDATAGPRWMPALRSRRVE
ncbi:MAG: hypothetical protein AAGF02_05925 [Actinomycetota bacterium]